MTTARFPSPLEVKEFLAASLDPAQPKPQAETLQALISAWPYPRGLRFWEGYVYADLLYQLGWARYHAGDDVAALNAWRDCPWPECTRGERLALGNLLQRAHAQQSLILAPAVSELLTYGHLGLSEVLAALDDTASSLTASPCGQAYVLESRLMRTEGVYDLRLEFDHSTLFFLSFLPTEVTARLSTARAFFQMGSAVDAASWMLRAAHSCASQGLPVYARSFLDKAFQLDADNLAVAQSLDNLAARGVEPTFLSRVVAERSLLVPAPLSRTAIRPEEAPARDVPALKELSQAAAVWEGLARSQDFHRWVGSDTTLAMNQSQSYDALEGLAIWEWWSGRAESFQTLLLPTEWTEQPLEFSNYEENFSRTRGVGVEEVGQWRSDHRETLTNMVTAWEEAPVAELRDDLPFPDELSVALFGLTEAWQIPLLFYPRLGGEAATIRLCAWLRRLAQKWGGLPVVLSEDIIWLYFSELPERASKRSRLLADLLNMSEGFEACFEPDAIVTLGEGWIMPVPYTP